MDATLKAQWVAALRSGAYRQGRVSLYTPGDDTYCCLGVLCKIAGGSPKEASGYSITNPLLGDKIEQILWTMNDTKKKSFAEIADWIETNV